LQAGPTSPLTPHLTLTSSIEPWQHKIWEYGPPTERPFWFLYIIKHWSSPLEWNLHLKENKAKCKVDYCHSFLTPFCAINRVQHMQMLYMWCNTCYDTLCDQYIFCSRMTMQWNRVLRKNIMNYKIRTKGDPADLPWQAQVFFKQIFSNHTHCESTAGLNESGVWGWWWRQKLPVWHIHAIQKCQICHNYCCCHHPDKQAPLPWAPGLIASLPRNTTSLTEEMEAVLSFQLVLNKIGGQRKKFSSSR